MPTALVVDDLKIDQRLAGSLLEDRTDLTVRYAGHGKKALAQMSSEVPDVVLTDMQMPEMDGLQLVEAMRRDYPSVPVVLMTAHGSEDLAAQALKLGAASYVPKSRLSTDLVYTVQRVLDLVGKNLEHRQVLEEMIGSAFTFRVASDEQRIAPLVGFLREQVEAGGGFDAAEMTRISVALDEAFRNAVRHGNLGLTESICGVDELTLATLLKRRRAESPYAERTVLVRAEQDAASLVCIVEDEGEGFDSSGLPDPSDPRGLEESPGRGLILIRSFMDEVSFNDKGNQIRMVKWRKGH